MIEAMRWSVIVFAVLGCESSDDYPAPPLPYVSTERPLVMKEGKLDGTGYRIEVPQGTNGQEVSATEVLFDAQGLKITVRLELESTQMILAIQANNLDADTKEERPDGWLFTYQGGGAAYGHTYVDDGGLTCFAQTPLDGQPVPPERTQRLIRICRSLQATTGIANPQKYPAGQSPRELRAGACSIALDAPRAAEVAKTQSERRKVKRPTKEQLADQRSADGVRDAQFVALQRACEEDRWSGSLLQCVVQATSVAGVLSCRRRAQ